MVRVRLFLLLLNLLIVFNAASGEAVCEWLGNSPTCGNNYCGDGKKEIIRTNFAYTDFAEFGKQCLFGEKTLCCKQEAVKGDFKKNCVVNHERVGCPATRPRLISAQDGWIMWTNGMLYTCCDPGTLVTE